MRNVVLLNARLPIAVYVSGHGFGHAVRVGRVLEALVRAEARVTLEVTTVAPERLFPRDDRIRCRPRRVDVGLVQTDALTPDLTATLEALERLETGRAETVADEAARLRASDTVAVLADIPAVAFEAAAAAGVRALALGNFSWDWIYRSYVPARPPFAAHAERAAAAYGKAGRLFRLPFHGDMSAFGAIEDVPLVVERSPLTQGEARRRLGLSARQPIVLLSFGGIGFAGIDAIGLGRLCDVLFLATEAVGGAPANVCWFDDRSVDYTTLLRASDVVVTKPGWGITASALVNGVRVLYTSRGEFPEYPVLVEALETWGTARFVEPERLRSADFAAELEELLARPVVEAALRADGAEVVARRLLEEIGS